MKSLTQQFPLLGYTTFDHGDDFFVFCKFQSYYKIFSWIQTFYSDECSDENCQDDECACRDIIGYCGDGMTYLIQLKGFLDV